MTTATATPPFGRMVTAMVTPFSADGELDLDGAQRLATHLVDRGCDGLVISGTTGESPTTSDAEKDALLRAVIEAVGDRAAVTAGVGTADTAHSVELAQAAQKAGAHGVLVVTPYYSKPPQAGLVRHFTRVADATDLPVMLYDIPGRTATPILTDTMVTLARHERIVAVKDARGDLGATSAVLAGSDLLVYSGDDVANLAMLAMGAVGVVSVVAHVGASQYAAMLAAVDRGDLPEARRINDSLIPVVRALMTRTQGAIAVKAALNRMGLPAGPVRPPLIDLDANDLELLMSDLSAAGMNA